MGNGDRVRIEVGFDGGQVITGFVNGTSPSFRGGGPGFGPPGGGSGYGPPGGRQGFGPPGASGSWSGPAGPPGATT